MNPPETTSNPLPADPYPASTAEPPPPAPEILARCDASLIALWNESRAAALHAAEALYAPDDAQEENLPHQQAELAADFERLLKVRAAVRPETPLLRYHTTLAVVRELLQAARTSVNLPFIEDRLTVALRPVRRLKAGALTAEVCAVLHDYHRGVWTPHLTKPQLYRIQDALAKTLQALPPDAMQPFWDSLRSDEPMRRHAMLLGVELLRHAHAVPHLLRGLEQCPHHDSRIVLVAALEQISDPHSLQTLMRLRRETASTDWTLSRHIARAIRVIEQQNRNQNQRTLLRPSDPLAEPTEALLRPASPAPHAADDNLLRPGRKPEEKP